MNRELFMATGLITVIALSGVLVTGKPGEPQELPPIALVFSGDKPSGGVWAKCGAEGSLTLAPNGGTADGRGSLALVMTGTDARVAGFNWMNWYPKDAHTDASKFTSLVIHVRQVSEVADADLSVALVDNTEKATVGNRLSLRTEGGLERISGNWQKAVLSLADLKGTTGLQLDRVWGLEFSSKGGAKVEFRLDSIGFGREAVAIPKFAKEAGTFKATTKFTGAKSYPIDPRIYGTVAMDEAKLAEYAIPITRWGGNATSRFNWKINADSGAADWFFKNRGTPVRSPEEGGWAKFTRDHANAGRGSYVCVPTLGWVAKDRSSYSFPVREHGPQTGSEPGCPDAGNGVALGGRKLKADPNTSSVTASPEYVAEGVRIAAKNLGEPSAKGRYWVLDNEPMLWHETHRDVRDKPVGYDELWKRTVEYAEAIRAADPEAKIAGFCSWGWTDLFYSALDAGHDQYATHADNAAHGGIPLGEWFVMKCGEYRKQHGKPLIDVFDFHWYPQAKADGVTPYDGKGAGRELNELRLRTVRDLWDSQYKQESWIAGAGDRKPTEVIHRVRRWILRHDPEMKLSLGEYNFGGGDTITGGLAQADVFGVLAREKVDLAFIWTTPQGTQDLAFQLFRDYDGRGARFAANYVPTVTDSEKVASHIAKDSDKTTAVVVNRDLGKACVWNWADAPKGKIRVFRFDQDRAARVEELMLDVERAADGAIRLTLPAASATLVEVVE